jgi:hypothetical protein
MQEHQIHTTIHTGGYMIYLRPSPQMCRRGEMVGGGCPAMPVSPGHVRRLHSYPPSRRRRR